MEENQTPKSAGDRGSSPDQRAVSREESRDSVRDAYSRAAESPGGEHPFPVGRGFAQSIGYPVELLAWLPAVASEAFAGVSNLPVLVPVEEGQTVVDIGCGSGLDALIASLKTGTHGRVIGIDFSESMLNRAREAAREAGIANIEFLREDAENLPLQDASVDVAMANGIFNPNPRRDRIFAEIARVLKAGGPVYAAEIVLGDGRSEKERQEAGDWSNGVAGAKEESAFLDEFQAAGFREITVLRKLRNERTESGAVYVVEVKAEK